MSNLIEQSGLNDRRDDSLNDGRAGSPSSSGAPSASPTLITMRAAVAGMSATGRFLCGGSIAVAIASLMPWAVVSDGFGGSISSSPQGGGPVLLMVLAAAALWSGWPSLHGDLSKRRSVALTLVTGLLALFVMTNWSDLGHLQSANSSAQISAGAGLYLYTAGVASLVVSTVRALRTRRPR